MKNKNILSVVVFILITFCINYAHSREVVTAEQETYSVEEVLVTGRQLGLNFEPTVQMQKLLKTAGTLGDPVQAVFSLSGVVQVNEEEASPAVRGSSPGANSFLVDGVKVDYLFHFFGNSVFNENLIQDFGLKSAGFGAEYGAATGAIFDVSLRDPRNTNIETTIDISFLMAGVLTEGAISKNQSFYLAYRESLMSLWVFGEDIEEDFNVPELPSFNDYQGKYLWRLGDERALIFSVNGVKDEISAIYGENNEDVLLNPGLEGNASVKSEFHNQNITWRSPNLDVIVGHGREKSKDKVGNGEYLDYIEDVATLKAHTHKIINRHELSIGAMIEHSLYDYEFNLRLEKCSDFTPDCSSNLDAAISQDRIQRLTIFDTFIQDEYTWSDTVSVDGGLHITKDDYLGELQIDPRVRLNWDISEYWSATSSVGRYHQLPDLDEMFPVIGNPDLTSINSNHYVMGVNHIFKDSNYWLDSSWSMNLEAYYKDINNLIVDVDDVEIQYLNQGKGSAYGFEFMINKDLTDRWYGWLNIALAKTERTNLLTGETTLFSYDIPVLVNWVAQYQMTKKWSVGGRWTYRSGTLYTPIVGNKPNPHYPDYYLPVYDALNSERADSYHRLDVRFERNIDSFVSGVFFVDILNVYDRDNASGIDYVAVKDSDDYMLVKREGYGIFPSIGVKIVL